MRMLSKLDRNANAASGTFMRMLVGAAFVVALDCLMGSVNGQHVLTHENADHQKQLKRTDLEAGERCIYSGSLIMAFRWCPPGISRMGSPETDEDHLPDEERIDVQVDQGFWIGECEVTQRAWSRVMATYPWRGQEYVSDASSSPASFISYDDATQFCEKLTDLEVTSGAIPAGWHFRLPSEAEWEYACRAGSVAAFCYGDDRTLLVDYAWYNLLSRKNVSTSLSPQPVGQKRANNWGLHDVHGNVFEWCSVTHTDDVVALAPVDESPMAIIKGGGWDTDEGQCRSAFKASLGTDERYDMTGLRIVLSGKAIQKPTDTKDLKTITDDPCIRPADAELPP